MEASFLKPHCFGCRLSLMAPEKKKKNICREHVFVSVSSLILTVDLLWTEPKLLVHIHVLTSPCTSHLYSSLVWQGFYHKRIDKQQDLNTRYTVAPLHSRHKSRLVLLAAGAWAWGREWSLWRSARDNEYCLFNFSLPEAHLTRMALKLVSWFISVITAMKLQIKSLEQHNPLLSMLL